MKAVVLVGGQGTRLRPLTYTTPKQLLPVGRKPILERVVEHLSSHGVDEVILSLGYQPDAFRRCYPGGRCGSVRLRYAVEDHPLDTAGAILFASRQAGVDDTFVVVNGDVLTSLDVGALLAFHRRTSAGATIALTPVEDPSAFGVVLTGGDGRVQAFIEKPPRDQAPSNLINAGTYVFEPSVLDYIPSDRPVSVERETFPALAAAGLLAAMASDAEWMDVGTPAKFLEANLASAASSLAPTQLGANAKVINSVLGAGVVVESGATVEGSVLFDAVRVGSGASVRDSIVGTGAVIGTGTAVHALSVIGDGVVVPDAASLRAARIPQLAG